MSALEQTLGGPATEVVAKATRRRFTVEYKRKIVREADACKTAGAIGALLRREGLYSSHLTTWRVTVARRPPFAADFGIVAYVFRFIVAEAPVIAPQRPVDRARRHAIAGARGRGTTFAARRAHGDRCCVDGLG